MTVAVPRMLSSFGDCSFATSGPRAWNKLPSHLRLMQSADTFRRHLKTFLFFTAGKNIVADIVVKRLTVSSGDHEVEMKPLSYITASIIIVIFLLHIISKTHHKWHKNVLICAEMPLRWWLQLGFRLCISTALLSFNDLRHDRAASLLPK